MNKTKNSDFGLVAALRGEIAPFLRRPARVHRLQGPVPAWSFHIGDHHGVAAESGMGAAAARRAALALINTHSPQVIISLGFGGALSPGLSPGAVVLGREYWDYDPAAGTLRPLAMIPPAGPLEELVSLLHQNEITAYSGTIISSPAIIAKEDDSAPLLRLPNPVLDLETTAVARVAAAKNLPFLGIRAITDTGEEEIADFLKAQIAAHQEIRIGEVMAAVLKKPTRLLYLLKLAGRARLAGNRLAQALVTLLPLLGKTGQ